MPMEPEERTVLSEQIEMKEFGSVVVCAGSGIEAVFRDLGADMIITGGQTMNPSTECILESINKTPSNVVFVLPNNKNIIMAAQQCIPLTEKRVIVVPTMSIPQGISAMLAVDGLYDIEEISASMAEAAKRVQTALITLAARDSVFGDVKINEGEYIALIDDTLAASGSDINAVIYSVVDKLNSISHEFITIFVGESIDESDAAFVAERIGEISPDTEVSLIHGGQPVYHYIISAE